jgi:hypothetical protein
MIERQSRVEHFSGLKNQEISEEFHSKYKKLHINNNNKILIKNKFPSKLQPTGQFKASPPYPNQIRLIHFKLKTIGNNFHRN